MFDVVVIGGGPAGSAAAFHLARQGVKVAVLERGIFPRPKICGEILSGTAINSLVQMELGGLLSQHALPNTAVWHVQLGPIKHEQPMPSLQSGRLPHWVTIPRLELDAALAAQARRAGAEVFEGVTAKGLEVEADCRRVRVTAVGLAAPCLEAQLAIIATGSAAGSGKHFTPQPPTHFAIRGHYRGPKDDLLALYCSPALAPGYEWQIPVGEDRYNIGIYVPAAYARRYRLDELLRQSRFVRGKQLEGRLGGGWLNTHFGQALAHADHVLRVGDAAGLVQPHLGEGIAPALLSGELAACHAYQALQRGQLDAPSLRPYTAALRRAFAGEMRLSRLMAWCMQRHRLLVALGNPVVLNLFARYKSVANLLSPLGTRQHAPGSANQ